MRDNYSIPFHDASLTDIDRRDEEREPEADEAQDEDLWPTDEDDDDT